MEFMILLGMLIVMLASFLLVISILATDKTEEKAQSVMKDLGISIQNELILASDVQAGYNRTITVPDRIEGIPVSLTSDSTWIYVEYHGIEQPFRIPNITGTFTGPGRYRIESPDPSNPSSGISRVTKI
jgi:hypothetical protein